MATNYGTAVIAAAQMFLDKIVKYPYIQSKFAILANAKNVEYNIYGDGINVREVTPGKATTYDENDGFVADGNSGTVKWTEFKATYDRKNVTRVPFMTEVKSILAGMQPSTIALIEMWWVQMGEEIDACIATTIYGSIPDANKLLQTNVKLTEDTVFGDLIDLKWKIYKAGVAGKIYIFVSEDVAATMGKKLANGYGLANPTVLTINPQVSQDVADRVGSDNLEVNVEATKIASNCYVIPVPSNRMYTKIVLNDGKSAGQLEGGYTAASAVSGFANIKVLAVPEDAAFVAIRHLVANITVPQRSVGLVNVEKTLSDLNGNYYGNASIQNIGVDQNGDWFKSMSRILHGGGVFDNYKHTIFSVTDTPVA